MKKLKLIITMRKFIGFFICFLSIHALSAQNSITGTIVDDKNKPMFFATIALLNQVDSTIVKGESTDDQGYFELKNIADGTYFLEASMLGYKTKIINDLSFPASNGQAVDIKMGEDVNVLSTVEVVDKIPLYEQKPDRLVVNIANNVIGLTGNLMDVMKKVPGVLVINNKLSLGGVGSPTILINGKTTKYMDVEALLRDMPGDNIKSVEVIHQPGAEFEAEGSGPIINIILKKSNLVGTNGSASIGVDQDKYTGYNAAVSLNHYKNNLNINGGLGYSKYIETEYLSINRKIGADEYKQQTNDPIHPVTINANLGLDWALDSKQTLGVEGTFLNSRIDKIAENETAVNYAAAEEQDLQLVTKNNNTSTWTLFTLNPYYSIQFDSTDHKLDFDLNYISYNNTSKSTLSTQELNQNLFFEGQRYNQLGKTTIGSSKLDYSYPFSKGFTLQVGGKYSFAELDNDLGAELENEKGVWGNNPLQTNHFIYEEAIYATYAKLNFSFGKLAGTAGLRYENSQAEGKSVTLSSNLKRNLSNVFPSFSLSHPINSILDASVAYSYRIDRPDYATLNPFVSYLDPYTYDKGNPLLQPALTHSTKFTLSYEKQPFFNLEYKRNKNAMTEVTEQNDETGEAYQTVVNLESLNTFSSGLFFPLDFIPKISGYGGVMANHVQYNSPYLDETFNRSRWTYIGIMQLEFVLPGEINSEISAWYTNGGQDGIMEMDWLYGVDVAFSKKFLDGKAKISVGVDDLFNRFPHINVNYANMDANIVSRWDTPFFTTKFTYKFGNNHLQEAKKWEGSGADEQDRIQD